MFEQQVRRADVVSCLFCWNIPHEGLDCIAKERYKSCHATVSSDMVQRSSESRNVGIRKRIVKRSEFNDRKHVHASQFFPSCCIGYSTARRNAQNRQQPPAESFARVARKTCLRPQHIPLPTPIFHDDSQLDGSYRQRRRDRKPLSGPLQRGLPAVMHPGALLPTSIRHSA